MGFGSVGQGGRAPPGFLLFFFRSFFRCPPPPLPWKKLNSTILRYFLLFFGIFSVASLENFPSLLVRKMSALAQPPPPLSLKIYGVDTP